MLQYIIRESHAFHTALIFKFSKALFTLGVQLTIESALLKVNTVLLVVDAGISTVLLLIKLLQAKTPVHKMLIRIAHCNSKDQVYSGQFNNVGNPFKMTNIFQYPFHKKEEPL